MSVVTPLAPPMDASAAFLEELYGTAEEGWLTLFVADSRRGTRAVEWAPATDTSALASLAAHHAPSSDVWFGVATRRERLAGGKRGGDKDCAHLPGLWVDIDIAGPNHKATERLPPSEEAALDLIWSFNLPASVIVHTGGGLHAYWLFGEMKTVPDVQRLLPQWGITWQRLAYEHGWRIDNVWDPARILRLPGTFNRKGEPTPVRVLERWLR